jgi:two-component system nitrogen regulation sensor histidine kinase GlnL
VKEKGSLVISLVDDEVTNTVRIGFANTGPAIPPGIIGEIFKPGFTTRPDGAGMGLAIAADMAALHGGSVTARSDLQETVFEVVLPRV